MIRPILVRMNDDGRLHGSSAGGRRRAVALHGLFRRGRGVCLGAMTVLDDPLGVDSLTLLAAQMPQ